MWDKLSGLNLTRGSLIASSEVSSSVSTSHDIAGHCCHRADNNCLARGNGSETQIKPLYEFERRNELDGGSVGRGVWLQHKEMLSAIKREGDDAIVIFGIAGQGVFRIGHTT